MEIVEHFKRNGYFTSQLYLLLEHKKIMPEDTIIIPSVYIKNMKMTTMERLQHMAGMELTNVVSPDPTKPIKPKLEFTPRVIVFQNFQPNDKIVTKLTVKNIHHSPTYVNMKGNKPASCISLKPVGTDLLSRIAPGISATYSITFTPTTLEDSVHEISWHTDTDKYVVVLIAMAPRPIFNFPDEIIVPPTPLKVEKSTEIIVKNISQTFGTFTVQSMCPVSVYPKMSYIQAGEQKELKISIKTMHTGNTEGMLLAKYETEEIFKIKVKGSVYSVSIELEKSVVRFLDTYNTMLRQQTFKITNKSNDLLTFMCMKNPSLYQDFNDKVKLARIFYDMKESEKVKYGKLVHYDVLSSIEHNRVYTRIFFDEIHSLVADESLQFRHQHFSIMPIHGCLWPNKTTEITITFEPKAIGEFQAVAYLDLDGTTDRVPLTLQGTSLPPNIYLNVETLDMDNAYINKVYSYEILAINRGHINGVIQYRPVEPLFGSIITCTPDMHCLRPGEKQVFVVSFLNSNQGPYFEELQFFIRETSVVRKLYIKGKIIYPTLTFGVPCLDFNVVSVGVPKTLQVEVINESEVKVSVSVKISSDGPEVSAITLEDCEASNQVTIQVPHWPREFQIDPSHLELGAFSKHTLQVRLTANLARTNHTFLELELVKSDSPPITLPLSFEAKVPEITPAPDINLRACFIEFTYTYDIVINCDGHWGFFTILPPEKDSQLEVQLDITKGIIRPNTTLRLPCNIRANTTGPQNHVVRMSLFGLRQPIDICHISCLGVKPIVTCSPTNISFGQLKLLNRVHRTLTLNNDSPVVVYFKAAMLHKDTNWEVNPPDGCVQPEAEMELTVSVCLVDVDTYTNKVFLQLEKVKDICIPVSAIGCGTSIVVGNNMNNNVNVGRHFCKLPMIYYVPIKNCGTKLHILDWLANPKGNKTQHNEPRFFTIEPQNLKLRAGEKIELKISAISMKANIVRETWCLVGSVEGANKKETLLMCDFIGEFVEPKLIIHPTAMEFRYDYGPYSEYYKLTDVLTVKNMSMMPLDIEINTKPPFAIIQREGTYKCDSEDEDMCCCISYHESDLNMQKINENFDLLEKNTFIDCITNKPVPKQNRPLEFFQNIHKLKMAFNLTHTVEETLQDKEYMKIQILFDTTKHTSLKSKVYTDLMRIRFKGHKNKDAVRLAGVVHFPNVSVLTPKIDFQCVLNGSIESRIIKLYNPTELLVCYTFQWKKCNVTKTKPQPEISNIKLEVENVSSVKLTTTEDETVKVSEAEEVPGSITEDNETKPLEAEDAPKELEQQILTPSLPSLNTEEAHDLLKTRILQKITPMIQLPRNSPLTYLAHKLPKRVPRAKTYDINEIFLLIPHQGKLKPDETHEIHIMFKPLYRDVSIRALLECKVLGGPTEIISVSGQSSDLLYKLNTRTLNFKIRSFQENASDYLVVTNISQYPIEFTTYLNEPKFENNLPATILELVPPESVINPEEEAQIKVQMRVGILGFFSRTFTLELGHLPHIPIEVFGWGVIPQVYLSLPRPGMIKINTEIGYLAIATLTIDYLDAVRSIFDKSSDVHLNSAQMEKCFEDPDLQEEWHICSAWDGYPSIMDIEMAVERQQVVKHINAKPEILEFFASSGKGSVIPGYQTTSYVVDFGVMITDSSVTCSIDMVNYGPTPVRVHFAKASSNPKYWLDIKLCTKLEPGETGRMEITFFPKSHDFPEYEQILDHMVYLEVPYGVTIPLNVKSQIAVPFLKCNVDKIDFGSVRCGDKVIISVPLKNTGKPTCIWYVTLKVKTPGPPAITIVDTSGKYEPGEGGWLSIAFKPTMEITYEGVLIFRFYMNHTRMVIPIKGSGLFPRVHIIGPNMHFPPSLPWSDRMELYFGITNPCPFPIELIIAHVDEEWHLEEDRLQLLYKYYNKPDEMLVPALQPGEGLPTPIREFYNTFNKQVAKELEAEAAAAKASAKAAKAKSVTTPKSPKGKAADKKDKEGPPVRRRRTEAEVIADEMKKMKAAQIDPLRSCFMKMKDDTTAQNPTHSGLLIFLHGSPGEEIQSLELAYILGMKLSLPTVNFDSCIIDALCTSESVAKNILMNNINENYENLKRPFEESDNEIPPELKFGEYLNEYEIIQRKVEMYINSLKIGGTPRSKASVPKKPGPAASSSPTGGTPLFSQDLIEELLKTYFKQKKFERGFVMDSLSSYILKNPPVVLTTAIKCKPSICNIHLALCLGDFTLWMQNYEDALRREEELAENDSAKDIYFTPDEIENIVSQFEEMDGDEYELADPAKKAIYIQYGLELRRQKYYEKRGPAHSPKSVFAKDKGTKEIATNAPDSAGDRKKSTRKDEPKGKISPELQFMQSRYNEYYKNVHDTLIQIACNWIVEQGELGYPLMGLNGQCSGGSQKKVKKPTKSEINLTSLTEVDHTLEKGFPFTILMNPCLEYREALTKLFTEIDYNKKMLQIEEPYNILEAPPKRQELSVLLQKTMPVIHPMIPLQWHFLQEPPIRKCECNQITDLSLLDDTTQDNVLNILAKWNCTCGKKKTSSETSTTFMMSLSDYVKMSPESPELEGEEVYKCPLPVRVVESGPAPLKNRVILLPGDLMRCKFIFMPTVEGHYSLKRFVEVAGWPDSRLDINSSAICDIPRLDSRPKKMFANFVRKTEEDQVYKHTFLDEHKKFVFGPIFTGHQRIYAEEYTIQLRNASLLTCEVTIEFMNNTSDIYRIDKQFMFLEPAARDTLTLSAAPAQAGEHENALLLCIKDNPEVIRINITCKGVMPVLEILPLSRQINYGKLLLYRREDDRFIIRNDSELPIMWTIRNPEDFVENFILTTTTGIIPSHENQVIPITYTASNVRVINQIGLIIDIYDELGRGGPMFVDAIYLSAECYDVLVECSFDNPSDNFLNFGNVKVNSTVYRDMYLVNRGLYNIYYKLKKVKNFPETSLLKSMGAEPDYGVILPGQREVAIEFNVTPSTKVKMKNVPAYTCYLLDGRKDQVVVAKFPVCITIASFYNTFTLFPLGELNFHIIAVGTGIIREVIINNTSKCPFNYEILVPEEYREETPPMVQNKDTKVKVPPIRCGNFCIINDDNLLLPGQTKIIFIQFIANAPRRFQEVIHFIVSDTCPAEAGGVPLLLVGTGAMPTIDFWDLENTFREHLIVKDMTEYKVKECTPHCVFEENAVMLHFFCVNVNTNYTGYIDLYNNGLVTAKVDFILHYQPNTNADIFSLEKESIHIDSFQHFRLGLIFTPKALQEYRAVLEIKVHKTSEQTESFSLCLLGYGVVPRIRIIEPEIEQYRLGVFQFPLTCLGSMATKKLTIKNICTVKSTVKFRMMQPPEKRPVFTLNPEKESEDTAVNRNGVQLPSSIGMGDESKQIKTLVLVLKPEREASVQCVFNPLCTGRTSCDIHVEITDNPYEHFTILCEAEAFSEDVILMGLEMLSLDGDMDVARPSLLSAKKSKSSAGERTKSKELKKIPGPVGPDGTAILTPAVLKYHLDFGGCELSEAHKRTVIMVNNSEKVYRFTWDEVDCIVVRPSIGYISPGEEKDLEIMFFSAQPVNFNKEPLTCHLSAVTDDTLTIGNTWDNRQTKTAFEPGKECINERVEINVDENPKPEENIALIDLIILYSAISEFTKYSCDLPEKLKLLDTYIYQKRNIDFELKNIGNVPLKVLWDFSIEEDYPARLDKNWNNKMIGPSEMVFGEETSTNLVEMLSNTVLLSQATEIVAAEPISVIPLPEEAPLPPAPTECTEKSSKATLFSESIGRESVDTWFEMDMPFTIEPTKACLNSGESQAFNVTFSPQEAFQYKVRLRSFIDKLDPYDQNVSCLIKARALVPYVHLEIEESNYLYNYKNNINRTLALPVNTQVLEFKVLGAGCYKKSFNVVNPTSEAYDYLFGCVNTHQENPQTGEKLMDLMHCDKLTGYVEGGTSDLVTFTFTPTAPGTYESHWKLLINKYDLTIPLLVVGIVLEPDVVLVPTILTIPHCLVGFTHQSTACLRNNEDEDVAFEYKSHTLMNVTGKSPVGVRPKKGVLRPHSEAPVTIYYTPMTDGPLSFKIFFRIAYMSKPLTLMVHALSYWIKPEVSYYISGNEHILNNDLLTRIHLEKTASTYERQVPFVIRNRGSMTFNYEWKYDVSNVKKYLNVFVEPRTGYLPPNNKIECILHFDLKTVPVEAFPLTLSISDGPEYLISLFADIEKPLYSFSPKICDFGKCFICAPDPTYKKNLSFTNGDKSYVLLTLDTESCANLFIGYSSRAIAPRQRVKIPVYFRPKKLQQYEFKLLFRVNSLCEEIITVRGEGVPMIFDLCKGCQRSFNLGPVKVGAKIIREIEVTNQSQIPIDAHFFFKEIHESEDENLELTLKQLDQVSDVSSACLDPASQNVPRLESRQTRKQHREEQENTQFEIDTQTAMESVKVIPSKCTIQPYKKVALKILFRPVGLITNLQIELNARVISTIRPLVLLSGSATGMSLCLSQNSLQFGRVLVRGCKVLKVMLMNQGDFGARFWWQPLASEEFTISPMQGYAEAHHNVTFNIQFRPRQENPYVKVWANCNIENYTSLDLAMYGSCLELETPQSRNLTMECRVRESTVEKITFTNPTEESWLVLSEILLLKPGDTTFETLREFAVPVDTSVEVPITFSPKRMGTFNASIYFAPLGESALSMTLTGTALPPGPSDTLNLTVEAKKSLTVVLSCKNISEQLETYAVQTEVVRVKPENFEAYYEIKHPQFVKCWGKATTPCNWQFISFETCEMFLKVTFIQQDTMEFQYYDITVTVTPSAIIGMLKFCCRAREVEMQEISITNPLDKEADFELCCESLKISQTMTLFNKSQVKLLTIIYAPLIVGEFEDFLTIKNDQTGEYKYRIQGICFPAKEKDMEFTTPLGTIIPVKFRVINKTEMVANFISWSSHPSILLEKEYEVPKLQKGKLVGYFEPTELGEHKIKVSLNCAVAGEFVFNIRATGTEPLPQGPINVRPGPMGTGITFKNIFNELHSFRIFLDNQEFYVKRNKEQLQPKEKVVVQVYLADDAQLREPPLFGCLTIENYQPAEPKVQWSYFLEAKRVK